MNIDMKDLVAPPEDPHLASYVYKIIKRQIEQFEAELDPSREVLLQIVSSAGQAVMSVDGIGYANPSIIIYYGTCAESRGVLLQIVLHITPFLSVSVLCAAYLDTALFHRSAIHRRFSPPCQSCRVQPYAGPNRERVRA